MLRRGLKVAALLAFASATVFGADVTGKWTFHVKFLFHSGDPWFEFQQNGEALTGLYHGHFGDKPLNGTVKGNQMVFTIDDKQGTATYTGTITGDTVKGSAKYPFPLNTGKFEGKRSSVEGKKD